MRTGTTDNSLSAVKLDEWSAGNGRRSEWGKKRPVRKSPHRFQISALSKKIESTGRPIMLCEIAQLVVQANVNAPFKQH